MGVTMGYRVKRIKQLEEENAKLQARNVILSGEVAFWHREAVKQAAELGEMKIKIAKAVNKLESMQDRSEEAGE